MGGFVNEKILLDWSEAYKRFKEASNSDKKIHFLYSLNVLPFILSFKMKNKCLKKNLILWWNGKCPNLKVNSFLWNVNIRLPEKILSGFKSAYQNPNILCYFKVLFFNFVAFQRQTNMILDFERLTLKSVQNAWYIYSLVLRNLVNEEFYFAFA